MHGAHPSHAAGSRLSLRPDAAWHMDGNWEHKQKEGTNTTQQFSSPTGMACTTMTMGGQQVRGPARKEHAGVRSGAFPGVMCSTTNAPSLSRSSAAVAARAPTCQAATRRRRVGHPPPCRPRPNSTPSSGLQIHQPAQAQVASLWAAAGPGNPSSLLLSSIRHCLMRSS